MTSENAEGGVRPGPDEPPERFRAWVSGLLEREFPPRRDNDAPSLLGAGEGPESLAAGKRLLVSLEESGLSTPTWPKAYGGAELTQAELSIWSEELAKYEVPDLYPYNVGLNLVGPVLIAHATEEQRQRWLRTIRSGEEIWCQMFSEPDAGSDLAGLKTRAEQQDGSWTVTGQKLWTSRAHYSRWGLLLARHDPSLPKHKGITAFVLDMSLPGIELRPLRQINGDEHFNEVFLNEVVIDDAYRIGKVGEGWRVAITTLMHERASGARYSGIRRSHVVDLVRKYGAQNEPAIRQRVARILIDLELTRLTTLRIRAAEQSGATPGPAGSGGKLRWASTVKELTNLALELEGPSGMLESGDWQTIFLTAPSLSIRGGTDQIQRNIVGERVLGLPQEPRVDKGVAPAKG